MLTKTCSHKIPECANFYHENSTNRIFFLNSTLWKIRCSLNPKAQAVKAQRQLKPEPYFSEFFKSRAQIKLFKIFLQFQFCSCLERYREIERESGRGRINKLFMIRFYERLRIQYFEIFLLFLRPGIPFFSEVGYLTVVRQTSVKIIYRNINKKLF